MKIFQHPGARAWFEGRRALVVGLGKSGVAAANLLSDLGAKVAATDKRPARESRAARERLRPGVPVEWGGHRWLKKTWDLVVVSPGVPLLSVREAVAPAPVWGEMELGYRFLVAAGRWPRWSAAVTGTNGKTTTTALLGEIFRSTGRDTVVAGNIGTPLCEVADRVTPETALALEVSSYQLESAQAFRPAVGTVLNVTPDHLGRHGTLGAYARAKFRLFQSQNTEDAAVLNAGDAWCRALAPRRSGRLFWFGDSLPADGLRWDGRRLTGMGGAWPAPAHLVGRHNVENALAAAACARALGVPAHAIAEAFRTFRGVEHRLQIVRAWRGVRFINDSKATNVDSTRVALEALPGPLRLILGGEHKGSPYTPLRALIRRKAKEVLLIGEAAAVIARDLRGAAPLFHCHTLARAVERAARSALPGEDVLLSPACASFDQFDNFEHRGRAFTDLAKAL